MPTVVTPDVHPFGAGVWGRVGPLPDVGPPEGRVFRLRLRFEDARFAQNDWEGRAYNLRQTSARRSKRGPSSK
jgi:hypothetical protein